MYLQQSPPLRPLARAYRGWGARHSCAADVLNTGTSPNPLTCVPTPPVEEGSGPTGSIASADSVRSPLHCELLRLAACASLPHVSQGNRAAKIGSLCNIDGAGGFNARRRLAISAASYRAWSCVPRAKRKRRQAKLVPVRGEEYGKKRRYEGTEETINLLQKKREHHKENSKIARRDMFAPPADHTRP